MAGVLEHLRLSLQGRPKESFMFSRYRIDLAVLELETAKEILCEVFDTTSAEVEEMIRLRLAERDAL